MEEQEKPTTQTPALCEECKINPSKYKCPGCLIRSCSLPCVKAHKERTSCTGKKQYKEVVPISQFDDNLLLSDYNMLEDVKRVADSARRMREKMCGNSHFRLPLPLKSLRSAAANRKTKLLFFSTGMSKRQKNQTHYNYRKKYISWTIEWRFHSTNVVILDHGIHENRSLSSVVENHLKLGPLNHQLKPFCEESLDSLKFFIRKYPKGCKSPYRELNIKEPIRSQLANLVVLEYPVIHVFLPSHSYDFEVVKDAIPQRSKVSVKESPETDDLNQIGVTFREEEIEEDMSLYTQVSDLMNNAEIRAKSNYSSDSERVFEGSVSGLRVNNTCAPIAEDIKYAEKCTLILNQEEELEEGELVE
ncbi:OLC1v1001648C1 [Oldenlandia corymbosa var. corymbosa]|uniref:Box C/D snoRNA protein 1 n=1 Tax=Oldenlandia corymbosa var. corymbosa TaxID=529605 RepID=A0AAV1D8N6_OLDCO|nr:OLC1v1001648C1 [Oldenlandia corymbosa var. corymbosa]